MAKATKKRGQKSREERIADLEKLVGKKGITEAEELAKSNPNVARLASLYAGKGNMPKRYQEMAKALGDEGATLLALLEKAKSAMAKE